MKKITRILVSGICRSMAISIRNSRWPDLSVFLSAGIFRKKNTPRVLSRLICMMGIAGTLPTVAQDCPDILVPLPGDMNIAVDTPITWEPVEGVPGFIISIGTTPGGTDITDAQSVGNATTFYPPLGLPQDSDIYVTLTLFFFDFGSPDIPCPTKMFHTEKVITPPPCTSLSFPANGAMNVNSATNISWDYASTATGYRLSLGTSAGGTDLLDQDVGNVLTFNPPSDLPPDTEVFVTITPYNDVNDAQGCLEERFTTGPLATLPGCTSLISPRDGDTNVPLTPLLEWGAVPDATAYELTIGYSPFTGEILDGVPFAGTSTRVIDFEANRTFFIRITPRNSAGTAIGCIQESFSTSLGCGPYFDPASGELVTLNPELGFPDTVSFCENEAPVTISATDTAEGYRWFRVDPFGNETLLSETAEVTLAENGDYRLEAYNTVPQTGGMLECPTSKSFRVVSSEIATIRSVNVTTRDEGLRISVDATGAGNYEYALDDPEGPYRDTTVFENVPPGSHTVYVKDKNGCGIAEKRIDQDLTLEGFPKFFTPNGDGINDIWQFIPPPGSGEVVLETIRIFDKFGKLLGQIDPVNEGWDGNFNGKPLPASDYWFRAIDGSEQEIRGHFALKR